MMPGAREEDEEERETVESVLGCLLHKLYTLSLDGRPEVTSH